MRESQDPDHLFSGVPDIVSGKPPAERQDAERLALSFPSSGTDPCSPRPPPFACLPTEHHPDVADAAIDVFHVPTHRPEPIPRFEHYAKTSDATSRTTANPPVTHRHVGHSFFRCAGMQWKGSCSPRRWAGGGPAFRSMDHVGNISARACRRSCCTWPLGANAVLIGWARRRRTMQPKPTVCCHSEHR